MTVRHPGRTAGGVPSPRWPEGAGKGLGYQSLEVGAGWVGGWENWRRSRPPGLLWPWQNAAIVRAAAQQMGDKFTSLSLRHESKFLLLSHMTGH